MNRNFLSVAATSLLAALVASCESDGIEQGPISAAFTIEVEDITPSAAKITLTSAQQEVTSYRIVRPVPLAEFEYAGYDAVDRLAFIEERGTAAEAPYSETVRDLDPRVKYLFAAVGLDASGQIVTAPTFGQFETKYAVSMVETTFEPNPDGTFTFTGRITPNEYTISYRYFFNDKHNDLTEAEMKTYLQSSAGDVIAASGVKEVQLTAASKSGVTLAVLSYDDSGRAGECAAAFTSTESSASVIVDGTETKLPRLTEDADIFEGKVSVKARSEFIVSINKVEYGWMDYSGNGGVGKIENPMSACPYYTSVDIAGSPGYSCSKAVGRMTQGGNKFWTNLPADGQILVRVDLTYDETPRYYIETVEPEDPNLILEQDFDLFVWGGDYSLASAGKGTAPISEAGAYAAVLDGTEPGTKGAAAYTAPGIDTFSTPGAADSGDIANDRYLANRDMTGWEAKYISEYPGHIRLNKSSSAHAYDGYIQTPKLTKLTAASNVTLEFDMCRMGNNADDIYVSILGAGTYTGGQVVATGESSAAAVAASGTDFIVTADHCKAQANNVVNKPWAHIELTIAGATAETQIRIDASHGANSTVNRILLDNIRITK